MVNVLITTHVARPVVVLGDVSARPIAHFAPRIAVSQQTGERRRAGRRIVGGEQGSRFPILDQFPVAATSEAATSRRCAIASSGFKGVTRSVSRLRFRG